MILRSGVQSRNLHQYVAPNGERHPVGPGFPRSEATVETSRQVWSGTRVIVNPAGPRVPAVVESLPAMPVRFQFTPVEQGCKHGFYTVPEFWIAADGTEVEYRGFGVCPECR